MNIIDISWPITNNITEYKNKKYIDIKNIKTWDKDKVRESLITMKSHTGTHIDAPSHFLENGKPINSISLNNFIGPCAVIDLTDISDVITKEDLVVHQNILKSANIVLFKTKNSLCTPTEDFNFNFVYLDNTAADFIRLCNISVVGFDYLGIERKQPNHETHTILLQHNIVIIEGLRLQKVNTGSYFLVCLPIALQGIDAAFARAILITDISFIPNRIDLKQPE